MGKRPQFDGTEWQSLTGQRDHASIRRLRNKAVFKPRRQIHMEAAVVQQAVVGKRIDLHGASQLKRAADQGIAFDIRGLRGTGVLIAVQPLLQRPHGLADVHHLAGHHEGVDDVGAARTVRKQATRASVCELPVADRAESDVLESLAWGVFRLHGLGTGSRSARRWNPGARNRAGKLRLDLGNALRRHQPAL
jgi:hypothetical protein